jgi:hypothetical protein
MNIKTTHCFASVLLALSLLPAVAFAAPANWTVLIYGHADHNLTSAMRDDLLEMEQAPKISISLFRLTSTPRIVGLSCGKLKTK